LSAISSDSLCTVDAYVTEEIPFTINAPFRVVEENLLCPVEMTITWKPGIRPWRMFSPKGQPILEQGDAIRRIRLVGVDTVSIPIFTSSDDLLSNQHLLEGLK